MGEVVLLDSGRVLGEVCTPEFRKSIEGWCKYFSGGGANRNSTGSTSNYGRFLALPL